MRGTELAGAQPRAQLWGWMLTCCVGCAEAQVLFVQKLRDVVAEEQGDVCLEVEVSHEAAEVQWLKQGVLLQPSSKYQMQESGHRRTLTIRCLGHADRGTYRCESLHDRTQARLCVEREYHSGDRDGKWDGGSTSLLQGCCRLKEEEWAGLVLGWKWWSSREVSVRARDGQGWHLGKRDGFRGSVQQEQTGEPGSLG